MNETANKFVGSRAETLAREFLTRRPDVDLQRFVDGDLDLVATLQPSATGKVNGFMPFGVFIWGTDRTMGSEKAASGYATKRWHEKWAKSGFRQQFFLPVLALVFAVREDIGYYAWIAEPYESETGNPQLAMNEGLHCAKIERDSMDKIVETVISWYSQLAAVIVPAK